ncbi:hypothetical protein GCM10027018_18600 [Paenibacillus thermoaerophilus]
MSFKNMKAKLMKLDPEAELKIGCKSYCGPCSRYAFVYVNGRYLTAPTEDEVLEKVKKYLK